MPATGLRPRGPRRPVSAGRIAARRLGVLAILALLAWVVWGSPLFALREEGVSIASDGDVVDLSAARAAVEPFIGTPLPSLDLGAVGDSLRGVAGVWEAEAIRAWPHGLDIVLTERVPVAAIAASGRGYLVVDIEGVELASLDRPPGDLPVVTVPADPGNSRILAAVLTVAGALPPDLAIRVEAVRAETEDSVTLFLRNGPRIEWGSAEESALKAEVVRVLLATDAASRAVIDVSAPTLPVTRDG